MNIQQMVNLQAAPANHCISGFPLRPSVSAPAPVAPSPVSERQTFPNSWTPGAWNNQTEGVANFFSQGRQSSEVGTTPAVTPAAAQRMAQAPNQVERVSPEGINLSWYGNSVMLSNDGVQSSYGQNHTHYASQATAQQILRATQAAVGQSVRLVDISESYGGPYRPSNPQYALSIGGEGEDGVGTTYNVGLIANSIANSGLDGAYRMLAADMAHSGVFLSMEQFKAMFAA